MFGAATKKKRRPAGPAFEEGKQGRLRAAEDGALAN
jgi:hypothetical protein